MATRVAAASDVLGAIVVRSEFGDLELFAELEAEYQRTVAAVLRIRQARVLLEGYPMLGATIWRRSPYVDPLSLLQVNWLRRRRDRADRDPELALRDRALGTTINGIAQGMRNTG